MALRSCVAGKVFATILTILVAKLDPTYRECSSSYQMRFLKPTNIYVDAYPKLIVTCVMLVVSIYEITTVVKLKKKVHPLITLPSLPSVSSVVQEQENNQEARKKQVHSKIQRIDGDPNMFYEVKIESDDPGETKNPTKSLLAPTPLVPVSGVVQEQENSQQARDNQALTKIQRRDEDPNMFYDVNIELEDPGDTKNPTKTPNTHPTLLGRGRIRGQQTTFEKQKKNRRTEVDTGERVQCFNHNSEIFKVTKAALKMNLLTLVFFLAIVPNRILAIIYQNCYEFSGDCDYFLLFWRIQAPFRFCIALIWPNLILKQIDKIC